MGDATIKHVQWMDLANSAHSELANLHSRVTSETAAREDNHAALEDRITKEREHSKDIDALSLGEADGGRGGNAIALLSIFFPLLSSFRSR